MLVVENLVKQYSIPDRKTAGAAEQQPTRRNGVDGVSFEVSDGELFTLLGPSGCGKTTTLRSIAGLEHPDAGRISLDATVLFDSARRIDRPVDRRGLAMVFQSYAIWPHMTVFRNASFPLEVMPRRQRPPAKQIRERVERALTTVGLDHFSEQSATRLSGGQQQRLALARALVIEPPILLLDEPLSNLDAKLRENMRMEIKRLQRDMGLTAIYVTHDQAEALSMSSRVAIMNMGRIVQVGRPREIYGEPAEKFVADFMGQSNFVSGQVVGTDPGSVTVQTEIGLVRAKADPDLRAGTSVTICLRPEQLKVTVLDSPPSGANEFEGKLLATAFLGDRVDHFVAVGPAEIRVRSHASLRLPRDASVVLSIAAEDVTVLPG